MYFKRKIAIFNDFCIFREVLLEIAISHETNAISREKIAASREKYTKIVINRDFSAFLNLNISCLTRRRGRLGTRGSSDTPGAHRERKRT